MFLLTDFEFHIDGFMLYCTAKNLSKKTLASYEQSLKLFAIYLDEEFKINDIKKVHVNHIRNYIKYLQERGKYTVAIREDIKNNPAARNDYGTKISVTTVANYIRNIKVFFNWLYSEKEILKNPVEKLEKIVPERKVKKILTPDEIKKVLRTFNISTFHGFRNTVITKVLLDTGMRISECLSLTPREIDFIHYSILVTNAKNKQQRYVYFSPKMSTELKRWLKHRDRYCNSDYLFPTNRGTQLQIRNFEKTLREAGQKVGIEIHPHQLRNNFAKYYILNGGDWFSLCRILGHSSVEVTMKAYLDFTNEEIGRKYQQHSLLSNMDL